MRSADGILTLLGSIVTVALVTTIVVHAAGSASVLGAAGSFFTNSLKAATQS